MPMPPPRVSLTGRIHTGDDEAHAPAHTSRAPQPVDTIHVISRTGRAEHGALITDEGVAPEASSWHGIACVYRHPRTPRYPPRTGRHLGVTLLSSRDRASFVQRRTTTGPMSAVTESPHPPPGGGNQCGFGPPSLPCHIARTRDNHSTGYADSPALTISMDSYDRHDRRGRGHRRCCRGTPIACVHANSHQPRHPTHDR